MSTEVINLPDRIVTDEGEVIAKHSLLVKQALSGEVFTELRAMAHPDIKQYNKSSGYATPIDTWEDSGEGTEKGPNPETFEWTIPKKYLDLDVAELCINALEEKKLNSDVYIERLSWELLQMETKDMHQFVRCLLYVTHRFKEDGVLWGVGRGSSCASLIMYLLGINKVDPVKYNIPAEEFFK
jgi:DNA polymerase III alpha subunit